MSRKTDAHSVTSGDPEDNSIEQKALEGSGMVAWTYEPARDWITFGAMHPSVETFAGAAGSLRSGPLPQFLSSIDSRDRPVVECGLQKALAGNSPRKLRFRFAGAAGDRWMCLQCGKPPDGGEATKTSLFGVLHPSFEEAHVYDLEPILSSISHRTKNLLISIDAIAGQSAKPRDSLANYVEHLRGRIRALSCVYDLLDKSAWRGASIRDLVSGELALVAQEDAVRAVISGPNLLLKPRAAQSLGLAFHELSVNAVTFGALSNGEGQTSVRWTRTAGVDSPVTVTWHETGLPASKRSETAKGFGHLVLDELLPQELDAEVSYRIGPTAVRCDIALPPEWLVEPLE